MALIIKLLKDCLIWLFLATSDLFKQFAYFFRYFFCTDKAQWSLREFIDGRYFWKSWFSTNTT